MTNRDLLAGEYFKWLYRIVEPSDSPVYISYKKLLKYLHTIEFKVVVNRDQNRAEDGISMRHRFALELSGVSYDIQDMLNCLDGPCTVFEMIVALAVHCEEFMDDTAYGDRTTQWFWTMISNLGLSSMVDQRFDAEYVDEKIDIFLNRRYDPDGRGGLFRIRNCDRDLRDVEIWYQMCWYLNTIT